MRHVLRLLISLLAAGALLQANEMSFSQMYHEVVDPEMVEVHPHHERPAPGEAPVQTHDAHEETAHHATPRNPHKEHLGEDEREVAFSRYELATKRSGSEAPSEFETLIGASNAKARAAERQHKSSACEPCKGHCLSDAEYQEYLLLKNAQPH